MKSSARNIALKIVAFAAVAIPSLEPATARADTTMTAGTACVAAYGATGYSNNYGGMWNNTSTTMTVTCPLNLGAYGPTYTAAVTVFATDMNYNQDVSCTPYTKNAGSGSLWFGSSVSTSGTGSRQELASSVTSDGTSWNFRAIVCNLPPVYSGNMSGIIAFRSHEE